MTAYPELPPIQVDVSKETSSYSELPQDAHAHFVLHFYAAVYAVVHYMCYLYDRQGKKPEDVFSEHPFLAGYFGELRARMPEHVTWLDGLDWWSMTIAAWEKDQVSAGTPQDWPLTGLDDGGSGGFYRRLMFVLAGLVEEDSRFGTLFTQIQAPLPGRRPSLELLDRILSEPYIQPVRGGLIHALLGEGWVEVVDKNAPRSERIVRMPDVLWNAVRYPSGFQNPSWCRFYSRHQASEIADLMMPASFCARLQHVPALLKASLETDEQALLAVRGAEGSFRFDVIRTVARASGQHILAIDSQGLEKHEALIGPLCRLTKSMPVLTFDMAPGEKKRIPRLHGYHGAIGVIAGKEGGIEGASNIRRTAATLHMPALTFTERVQHWSRVLGDRTEVSLETLAERYHLPGHHIQTLARGALHQCNLEGRARVQLADVRAAGQQLNRQSLDILAEHISMDADIADRVMQEGAWSQLVVSAPVQDCLVELEQRCRHRERVLDRLGSAFSTGTNKGVRALFSGPSGTGKTLAAKLMAAQLGIDLYRVDLASVINKYIGETEKNLHRILSAAEVLDVILLLDEGDSLLGSRTDVKSSNDRYANLETNYLLQRLEHYQGIVFITTNLGDNIDTAFQRRMDVVVEFQRPKADERLAIWQVHLPSDHRVEYTTLEDIAIRCDLTGGQIRNAAYLATLIALDESADAVTSVHLYQAIRREYGKAGRSFPLDTSARAHRARRSGVQHFVDTLQ